MNFVDWTPTGIKVEFNEKKPKCIPGSGLGTVSRSLCMFSNHTSIKGSFRGIMNKFDTMYRHRAFAHWFYG